MSLRNLNLGNVNKSWLLNWKSGTSCGLDVLNLHVTLPCSAASPLGTTKELFDKFSNTPLNAACRMKVSNKSIKNKEVNITWKASFR